MTTFLMSTFWLFIAVLLEVTGTSLLLKTRNFSKTIPSLLAVGSYLLCFYALAQAMSLISPGLAYALWCGLGIILIAFSGFIFYQQKPDNFGVIGLGFIVAGCVTMGVFQ
ncbi:multidrug efflux SMR transporter [Brenneria goodwinii]|uniref:DMT family transporter n=1 Tax=Brenneria goodwinii TaxID=1109412 RepID=UPI000EF17B03|nr:SMR family transporter [Brenneria goodwinii]MCG8158902.1 multidrug efflux SMR transporter [Brenneria goodwinii]MCG8162505.1 multidrug efflux SMR transporter [Brenneria goodwinii]MCG8166546.1 multidrug efflux SMR transporter [Brenneria goodwinii]MCG8170522.1 multidrug efflux SMR transporter [Brenneria goodwinii]MCG8174478.1 multidrug efflux SMR transporter [Brenneria goodwinii]